jgi:hypothetical protein
MWGKERDRRAGILIRSPYARPTPSQVNEARKKNQK